MNTKHFFSFAKVATLCVAAVLFAKAETSKAQPTAQEWNKDVVGWNLGNQFECPPQGQDVESSNLLIVDGSINAETSWGNPVVTKATIDAIKNAGFNAIRIPIRWQNHITNVEKMTIDKAWVARIKEVVGWCLSNNLKVIINTHHDKWLEGRPTFQYKEENNRKLALLWKNIAREFGKYDYRVAFAGTNEVHVKDIWGKPTDENLAVQNSYNQTFINAVRATGGKNKKRHIIVQTYVCNPDFGLDGGLIIPKDINGNDYMSVEFHYYTPWDYAGECKYYFWGEPYKQYGETSGQGESDMTSFMDKVKSTWADKGLGVIIGEWGVTNHYKEGQENVIHENMTYYCRHFIDETKKRGYATFLWDNNSFGNGMEQFGVFDRNNNMQVKAPWILDGIMKR